MPGDHAPEGLEYWKLIGAADGVLSSVEQIVDVSVFCCVGLLKTVFGGIVAAVPNVELIRKRLFVLIWTPNYTIS